MEVENKHTPPPVESRWAKPVQFAEWKEIPPPAINLNVDGRKPTSPIRGFGRLWLRTYRIALPGIAASPQELAAEWKNNFSYFWSRGNTFYLSSSGITPGESGLINLSLPGGLKLATGALIMHEDDTSFSLMTVQGHMFSGWITFSCYDEDGLFVQIQALVRPGDLLYELSFRLGFGAVAEDRFWHQTLKNLASHFGVQGAVQQTNTLVDSRVQWQYFSDIWYNAGIRSGIYQVTAPFRWLVKKFRK